VLDKTEAVMARRRMGKRAGALAGDRADPSRAPGTDTLPQIKHIVVLMMENHSYDNYFGMLTDRDGGFALDADGRPTATNKRGDGSEVPLEHFAGTVQKSGVPTQTWSASHIQWAEGQCSGFVESIEKTLPPRTDPTVAMRYWTEADIPFYYALARQFALATCWFSSCLGPTFPNRRFLTAGTAHGLIDDLPFGMMDYPDAGTIFDLLTAHGISWANYHNVPAWQINLKRILRARGVNFFRLIGALLAGLFPQLMQSVESKVQATADLYPLGTLRSINHLKAMDQFYADARRGKLPAFSIVDPDFGQTSEENPQDIAKGEAFSAKVINALMQGQGWPGTVVFWLYDEHGGYYDHVDPPIAGAPDNEPGQNPMKRFPLLRFLLRLTPYPAQIDVADAGPSTYEQLGFRVPAVVVSPFARSQYVSTTTYDHTSILRLVEDKWNLPSLTERDKAANSPVDMLDLDGPPAFLAPPSLPPPGGAQR
jgi:phospholipase C